MATSVGRMSWAPDHRARPCDWIEFWEFGKFLFNRSNDIAHLPTMHTVVVDRVDFPIISHRKP